MQEFIINKGSVNPPLEMELIDDGSAGFHRSVIDQAIQDAIVTFSMKDEETGKLVVACSPASVVPVEDCGCFGAMALRYDWKPRDVKKEGYYKGWFEITFNGDIVQKGVDYPTGNLIVPINEDLRIIIK